MDNSADALIQGLREEIAALRQEVAEMKVGQVVHHYQVALASFVAQQGAPPRRPYWQLAAGFATSAATGLQPYN